MQHLFKLSRFLCTIKGSSNLELGTAIQYGFFEGVWLDGNTGFLTPTKKIETVWFVSVYLRVILFRAVWVLLNKCFSNLHSISCSHDLSEIVFTLYEANYCSEIKVGDPISN